MSAPTPLVSIVMPAWNAAPFIGDALASARAQGTADVEMFVVDDGSTDGTADIAQRAWPGVRLLRSGPRGGPAVARNAALRQARGEFVAFLDADDLWPEGKLQLQIEALERNPHYQLAVGHMREFTQSEPGAPLAFGEPVFIFVLGCGVFRRPLFESVGLLDEGMPGGYGEDTDWFMRAWEAEVPILYQKETTIHYRRHPGGMTNEKARREAGFLRAVKQSLARRRRNGDFRPLPPIYPQPHPQPATEPAK